MKPRILYKVVDKETRYGSNYMILKNENNFGLWKYFVETYPEFFPRYTKNTRVDGIKGSPGILCFDTFDNAKLFMFQMCRINKKNIIIKVKPLGKVTHTFKLLFHSGGNPEKIKEFYKGQSFAHYIYDNTKILGCVGAPSVLVLE